MLDLYIYRRWTPVSHKNNSPDVRVSARSHPLAMVIYRRLAGPRLTKVARQRYRASKNATHSRLGAPRTTRNKMFPAREQSVANGSQVLKRQRLLLIIRYMRTGKRSTSWSQPPLPSSLSCGRCHGHVPKRGFKSRVCILLSFVTPHPGVPSSVLTNNKDPHSLYARGLLLCQDSQKGRSCSYASLKRTSPVRRPSQEDPGNDHRKRDTQEVGHSAGRLFLHWSITGTKAEKGKGSLGPIPMKRGVTPMPYVGTRF